MGFLTRLLRRFRSEPAPPELTLTEEDIAQLRDLIRATRNMASHGQQSPPVATYEQLVRAAWANLAIEEPEVTIEQARAVIDRAWPEIVKNTPDLQLEGGYHVAPVAR